MVMHTFACQSFDQCFAVVIGIFVQTICSLLDVLHNGFPQIGILQLHHRHGHFILFNRTIRLHHWNDYANLQIFLVFLLVE